MKTLKFGGTSVANAQNIELVLDIIKNKAQDAPLTVIISALSGVTDLLQEASLKASLKDNTYKLIVAEIEKLHLDLIKKLIRSMSKVPY